jgi:hypothetical protein
MNSIRVGLALLVATFLSVSLLSGAPASSPTTVPNGEDTWAVLMVVGVARPNTAGGEGADNCARWPPSGSNDAKETECPPSTFTKCYAQVSLSTTPTTCWEYTAPPSGIPPTQCYNTDSGSPFRLITRVGSDIIVNYGTKTACP